MGDRDPRIAEHYDDLAPHWAEIASSPLREELIWPTLDGLLPPLDGQRVLDAGCGAGVTAAVLADRGADVVGADVSEAMLEEARERVPTAEFVRADLAEPLSFLDDGSVDVVCCQRVFSHLPDLERPLAEFARVLGDDGVLVASTHNPVYDYVVLRDDEYPAPTGNPELEPTLHADEDAPRYEETERYDVAWGEDAVSDRATYYRRPFEAVLSPLLAAGFDLDAVAEPDPPDAVSDHEAASEYDRPYPAKTLCLRASV